MNIGTELSTGATGNDKFDGQVPGATMQQLHSVATSAEESQRPKVEYHRLILQLQAKLKKTQTHNQRLLENEQQLLKNCRIQHKLIVHLRQQLNSQSQELAEAKLANSANARAESIREQSRVMSLDTALLRINGVEVPDSVEPMRSEHLDELDMIDMDEFQPIQDPEEQMGLLARMNAGVVTVLEKILNHSRSLVAGATDQSAQLMRCINSQPWDRWSADAKSAARSATSSMVSKVGRLRSSA